jgi:hypothetical protein
VSSTTAVTISALYGGVTRSSPLTVEAPSHPISVTGNYAGGGCSMVFMKTGRRPGGGSASDLLPLVSPVILLRRRRWQKLCGWTAALM